MKRILQIVNLMNRGGIETFLMNVYRNIDKTKFQFDFVVRKDKEGDYDKEIKELGGRIYYIPSRRDKIFQNKKNWDKFYKEHPEYETIHYHISSLSDITPITTAKKNHIKNIMVHAHSTNEIGMLHTILHKFHKMRLHNYCKNIYACSDKSANYMFHKKVLKDVVYLKNGIDIQQYKFIEAKRENIRRKMHIKEDTIVLGHVGRFEYPKNHDFLIDIFNQIHQKNENTILMLVGDGKLRENIEKKVNELGLEKYVVFLGVQKNVDELLMAMDILIFPSIYEGLPVSLIEAQTTGLKCYVSSEISKEVDVTGLVTFLDLSLPAEGWAEKINKEYSYKRQDMTERVAKNGYDIKETVQMLEEIYK